MISPSGSKARKGLSNMLQERICAGVSECSGNVADDNYPDMNKHACRNFLLEATTPAICAQSKCSKWLDSSQSK